MILRCVSFLALVLATLQSPQLSNDNDIDLTPTRDSGVEKRCVTERNETGLCVLYYQCKSNNYVNIDGENLIDARFQDDCPSNLHKCCLLPEVSPEKVPLPVPPPQKQGCGWRNPNGISIHVPSVDGSAGFAEFPWMVAVLKTQPKDEYISGGSLIHPKAVLTGAIAVSGQEGMKVRAGEWDTQTKQEIYPYQDRDVERMVIHKDFIKETLYYNVALLFLTEPMKLAPNVALVCLPPADVLGQVEPDTRCFASGWGKTKFGQKGAYSVILKKVEVPVVKTRDCLKKLRNTRLGSEFELHSSFLCAGGEKDVDTCKGDGGSPLVCPIDGEKNRYYQSGIVAWGIGCGTDGVPGVYTDVWKMRAWIEDKMVGLDKTVYNPNTLIVN